jgi:hypothetical protein
MSDRLLSRERYGEAFWRAHHEAWRHSELNQREYCEAQGIPLKAFGNWRAKFKAEPQPPSPKLLYRRRNLSHTLGHSLSHRLSHMTYGSPVSGPTVPPAREGHRGGSTRRTHGIGTRQFDLPLLSGVGRGRERGTHGLRWVYAAASDARGGSHLRAGGAGVSQHGHRALQNVPDFDYRLRNFPLEVRSRPAISGQGKKLSDH